MRWRSVPSGRHVRTRMLWIPGDVGSAAALRAQRRGPRQCVPAHDSM